MSELDECKFLLDHPEISSPLGMAIAFEDGKAARALEMLQQRTALAPILCSSVALFLAFLQSFV